MKYEEIKVGGFYNVNSHREEVIYKSNKSKSVVTIDDDSVITSWEEYELHHLEPIKKEQIPEEGLLVNSFGTLVYRLSDNSIYGFIFGEQSNYTFKKDYDFSSDDGHWKPATPEQQTKFVKMLKKECEKRGLFKDTKLEKCGINSDNVVSDSDYGVIFTVDVAWNKNGKIFELGKFATPLKEEMPTLELVSKAVKEVGDFTIEQTGSGVIILTPIKNRNNYERE